MEKLIKVKVVPNAKKNYIKEENGSFKVYLTAPALEGRANSALIECLSEYLNIKKREIKIVRGFKTRNKVISINN